MAVSFVSTSASRSTSFGDKRPHVPSAIFLTVCDSNEALPTGVALVETSLKTFNLKGDKPLSNSNVFLKFPPL